MSDISVFFDDVSSDAGADAPVPLHLLEPTGLADFWATQPAAHAAWAQAHGFEAEPGRALWLPGADGRLAAVLVGVEAAAPLWQLAALPASLPAGRYAVVSGADGEATDVQALRALGWALGALAAGEGANKDTAEVASLAVPAAVRAVVQPLVRAVEQVRRLVNAPPNVLGPTELAGEVQALAERHGAQYRQWVGDELPEAGFALVHAVGRAAADAPRVAELQWGDPAAPRLVIVGKGVCFDSGGLDLKQPAGMRWMKKDMGGAAHALALAELVIGARLPVHLTLVVPAVENAVGAGALRPGDVVRAGNGTTVEIENTDAEGRLVLADALHHALRPEAGKAAALVIDLATLTGAARVALGPDLPAYFSNDEGLARDLADSALQVADPVWRLPLWQPYRAMLRSGSADLANAASAPLAGAITAALFLETFVPAGTPWLHLDLFAWNQEERPGRPKGGEAQALRAVFALLQQRFMAQV